MSFYFKTFTVPLFLVILSTTNKLYHFKRVKGTFAAQGITLSFSIKLAMFIYLNVGSDIASDLKFG